MTKRIRLIGAALLGAVLVAGAVAGWFLWLRPDPPQGPLVVIDAGHGGSYTANETPDGLKESDVNLAIAKRLRKKLTERDYRVIMTRTSDDDVAEKTVPSWRYVGDADRMWAYGIDKTSAARTAALDSELQARVDVANRAGADVFVSIHNNASDDTALRGTETYSFRGDAPGKALADSVHDAVIAKTGNDSHGSRESGLYVCRWTNMPAVLVEGAYYTNADDAKALRTPDYQDRIAEGIADGLDRWFASRPLREIERQVAGPHPEALASAVSSAAFPEGAKVAVVLPAENTALGPSASALALVLDAPLFSTSAPSVSTSLAAELTRLNLDRVIVVGSESVDVREVGVAVTAAVSNRTHVDLFAEKTDPAAAALAAASIGVPEGGEVIIADATDTDAIAALASYAARLRAPVLLSEDGRLGEESTAFLSANRARIKDVIAIGCAKKPARPTGWPVTVVSNSDPDALAASLLARLDPAPGRRSLSPVVVDAANISDVFTAATESARRRQPLIQFRSGVLEPHSREFLANRSASVNSFLVLRDGGSIPPVSESALRKSVAR